MADELVPLLDDATDGEPVVAIAFSAYQLANMAAMCEVVGRYGAFNTGDWMICYRDRFPEAARRYAPNVMPNRTVDQMDRGLRDQIIISLPEE